AYTVVRGTVPNLNADSLSYSVLDGGRASTVKGGKGALALGAYKCNSFEGINKLGLYVTPEASTGKVLDVKEIFYIEQLPQPSAMKIDRDGAKLNLTVSKFFSDSEGSGYSNGYLVKINGGEPIEMNATTMDISAYINTPGRYTVEVMSKGNFAADENGRYDIASYSAGTYYISSGYKSMEYDYTITLNAPSGAEIVVQEGRHKLQFGTVPFADYYNVFIGDTSFKISNADMEKDGYVYIDDYLGGMVGSVVVYVEACSDNEQILTSQRTMASTVVTVALLSPSATYNLSGGNLAVTWSRSDNAIFYEVSVKYVNIGDDEEEINEIVSVITSLNSYTFEMGDIDNIVEVSVKALSHGYYDASEPAIATRV
ncbi:MAG: hypothetical protein K2I79_01870, partial [Clostridia bacterium]|nr:hypothetical protein [Clostridia bacterium]